MVWQMDDTKFFSENRQRNKEDENLGRSNIKAAPSLKSMNQRDDSGYYITAMNTKRNPDLITPEGSIRGNMYIRKHVTGDPENDGTQSDDNQKNAQQADSSDEEKAGAQIDDMFAKMKSQVSRYFLE